MNPFSKQQILDILVNSKLELTAAQFSDEAINRIQEFCSLLQKWNEKINLTSEKSALKILEKHVFDSLQYLRWLESAHKTLDIGSGAGFPGIPIKILLPDLELSLIDSQRKRCSFLREAVRSLKFKGVEVLEGRVEAISGQKSFSEQYDRVVFRGFSSFNACLEAGLPFLKKGGKVVLKKSPDELPDSTTEIPSSARIIESKEVEGFEGKKSLMMVIEKCST